MSDTPRTDSEVPNGYRFSTDDGVREYVTADFARRLEIELAAAQDRLQIDPGGSDKIDELEQAAQFLRHTIERLKEDLAAVTLERDALAQTRNFHRDRGITLLDAKYLDPACHKGCQSLVWQEKLSTSIDESCELRAQLDQLETLILEDKAGAQVIKTERDKLLRFYDEIVKELGHDCVLRELRKLREENQIFRAAQKACADCDAPTMAEVAALREDKTDLDWLQCDPQNRFVRAISTWMKVGSNPSVITIRDAIRAVRKENP